MALRLSSRLFSTVIKDVKAYEAIKTSAAPVMVGWFTAKFSTASKMYTSQFDALADGYPGYAFFKCDVDDAPQVAYDAEVADVPSVVILPLGYKPDGSLYDQTDRMVVAPELGQYNDVIRRAKEALDGLQVVDRPAADRKVWEFNPATGTTIMPHE